MDSLLARDFFSSNGRMTQLEFRRYEQESLGTGRPSRCCVWVLCSLLSVTALACTQTRVPRVTPQEVRHVTASLPTIDAQQLSLMMLVRFGTIAMEEVPKLRRPPAPLRPAQSPGE